MEKEFITLRKNQALTDLSNYAGRTIDEVQEKIIGDLIKHNVLSDIPEECGETLENILIENDHTLESFAVHCFKVSFPKLLKILKNIQIWGIYDECEDCGCELEEDETEMKCVNPVCGCSIQTVYERDPDEYRDDCPLELLQEFNLN